MINVTQCPACSSNDWSDHLSCIDFTVSHETFILKKCNTCSLIATSPRPDDGSLSKYYQSDNYISHTSNAVSIIDKLYLFVRSFTLKWKLDLVNSQNQKSKTILDYGCGTGDFLQTCKQNGWTVHGVEPSSIAREKAIQKTAADIVPTIQELKDQKFSVITLWHVLEHVPDLNNLISKLASLLDENGTLFIAVPNHDSLDGQHYKEHWAGYDVPRHLWHFSRKSMLRLLTKNSIQIGQVIPMKLDSFYVSMLSEKYKNNGKIKLVTLIKAFLTGLKSNRDAQKSGAYSSLIYVARK